MKIVHFVCILACLIINQIELRDSSRSIPIGPDFYSKFYLNSNNGRHRLARFGNVNSCGKRKRHIENARKCLKQCDTDADCRGSKRRCLCDGECGLSCVRITTTCNKIDYFENGIVSYHPDNFFGSQLFYECSPGYTLIGSKTRTCEGDGWWSGEHSKCVRETFCQTLPEISNAIPNVQMNVESKFKAGTEIEYQCDIGYFKASKDESSKTICLENGEWSQIGLKCNRVECEKPSVIRNGIIKANDYFYSSVIEYKCVPGYHIKHGDYLRECDLSGNWTGLEPTCEPIDCGEPPFLKNGLANYDSTKFESVAHYTCASNDFYLEGQNAYAKCLPNARWEQHSLKCVQKTCALDSNEYASKNYKIFASNQALNNSLIYPINTVIRIMCQTGYELVEGSSQLVCKSGSGFSSGEWSDLIPTCKKEMYCAFITPPENGLLNSNKMSNLNGYPLNTTVDFSCLHGYKLIGEKRFKCIEENFEAKWNKHVRINCVPEITISTKNALEATRYSSTATVQIAETRQNVIFESCKIDSPSMLLSYSNLMANSALQIFNEFNFLNATIGTFIQHGDTVMYNCVANSYASYEAKCLNGTLFMQQNCNELNKEKIQCTPPPKIPNGYNKYASTAHGSKALYQCFNGFELAKSHGEIRCVNGEWVGQVPACIKINCGFPGNLQNGRILYIGTLSEYTYQPYMNAVGQDKQIRYECDKDYKLIGPNGSTCINGHWKPSVLLAKCVKENFKASLNDLDSENEPLRSKISMYKALRRKNADELSNIANEHSTSKMKLKRLKKHKIKRKKLNQNLNSTLLYRPKNFLDRKRKLFSRKTNIFDLNQI